MFHDRHINIRLKENIWVAVKAHYNKNQDRFDSPSHLIRSAIMKFLKEEKAI